MDPNPIWTATARAHLRGIFQYMEQVSPEAATRTVQALVARAAMTATFPSMGRVVPEFGTPLIRELIEPPYRIIYERFPDRVEILAVQHGARRFPVR